VRTELQKLDESVKASDMLDVLEQQNRKILGAMGVAKADSDQLLAAWLRLKRRRQRASDENEA
jgi:hypothetical protein